MFPRLRTLSKILPIVPLLLLVSVLAESEETASKRLVLSRGVLSEKIEYEVARREEWIYPKEVVTFQNGVLQPKDSSRVLYQKRIRSTPSQSASSDIPFASREELREFLEEVQKESDEESQPAQPKKQP